MRTKLAFKKILTCILVVTLLGTVITGVPAAAAVGTVGDVDGNAKIDAADALLVLKAAVKKITLTEEQTTAGDVDATGNLDASDALMILQYAVGLRDTFPAQLDEQARYYYDRDHEYKVNYSDFDSEIVTLEDSEDAAAIVSALGGEPDKAPVEGYGVTQDNKLSYTPISNEAKRLGQTKKYDGAPSVSGTIRLGDTVVTYSVPSTATAYDAVPIAYSVYSATENLPIHLEATAFEDADRYANASTAYYDCNLPGKVSVKVEYEGYVNGQKTGGTPMLTPNPEEDIQGTSYPSFETTELIKSGTVKSGAYCTWFKFKYTNTGNTILDGEGNSTFRFKPLLYKKVGDAWVDMGTSPNGYYPLLDYVYPGESGELWVMFNDAGGSTSQFGFNPGEYRIVLRGYLRNERDSFNFSHMQVAGGTVTTSTFEFSVTADGGMTTPNAVKNSGSSSLERNNWLGNFEEFMSSYTTMANVGSTRADARTGVLYVQPAPWTDQIVLKVIHGNTGEISYARIPLSVETDSIRINLNKENENYIIKEDGTRTPMVMTQNMADMRGNIDRGPYCDQTILNELLNMKQAGVNTITTTHAYTGDYTGLYDMVYYMLDCARKLGFTYEGHALYYYRSSNAVNRVKTVNPTISLGNMKDMFNLSQIDAANGILARWNLIRYGDFYYYNPVTKEIPISIEENFGWMTYNLNNRAGIGNSYSDRLYYKWLEKAYNKDISALNKKYGSSYADFNDITLTDQGSSDGVGYVLNSDVYHDWTAATVELDLFRTSDRTRYYKEMLKYLDVEGAKVYLRSENAIFLAPGISETTSNAHYRQCLYEQYHSASVPEVLAASDIIYGDSSYCWVPYTDAEVYELTRQAAKAGFTTAKTPSFNHMTDIVINDYVGTYDYTERLSTGEYQKACAIGRNASLFTWCKAIYEAGGVPGTMWMDYACDLYVTSTQYKELQFFNEKIEEMLATEEGRKWATEIPEQATASPIADLAKGAYSYPESYIDGKITAVDRYNQILDFCNKNS